MAEGTGVTYGEGEFEETGVERLPAGDAELAGLMLAAGFGVASFAIAGFGMARDGAGEAEDGVRTGVVVTVAVGDGPSKRRAASATRKTVVTIQVEVRTRRIRRSRPALTSPDRPTGGRPRAETRP